MTSPYLRALGGGLPTLVLDKRAGLLGSSPDADYVLCHPTVSRCHAEIQARDDGIRIEDLGSTNGIKVNGKVVSSATLKEGDVIRLGEVELLYTYTTGARAVRRGTVSRLELVSVVVAGFVALALWNRSCARGGADKSSLPPAVPNAVAVVDPVLLRRIESIEFAYKYHQADDLRRECTLVLSSAEGKSAALLDQLQRLCAKPTPSAAGAR